MIKKILILTINLLLLTSCISEKVFETRLAALEGKLDKNTTLLHNIIDAIGYESALPFVPENNSENTYSKINYNMSDNVTALNQFLQENNYIAEIGYNFNTDSRRDNLLFGFKNYDKLRGFGMVQNGVVYIISFQMTHELYPSDANTSAYVVWNGDYIVFAVNGGISGDCGLFGYIIQGIDFSTITQTWTNKRSSVRYAGIRPYSEIINNEYYTAVYRVDRYMSTARLNMKTGDINFTDDAPEAKELIVSAKVNNLYYGTLIKDGYSTRIMAVAPQYYNIFNNYKIIRSDLTPTTLRWCIFSYTKRRMALIDFTDNIARPIYLTGLTDNKVPATLTIIPDFEYKGKYYIKAENSNYTQFEEIKVPYNLFDDKYIKIK